MNELSRPTSINMRGNSAEDRPALSVEEPIGRENISRGESGSGDAPAGLLDSPRIALRANSPVDLSLVTGHWSLPILSTTEEAIEFGREMTREQWLLCEGAKQAIAETIKHVANSGHGYTSLNLQVYLATKRQLYREAQEVFEAKTLRRKAVAPVLQPEDVTP